MSNKIFVGGLNWNTTEPDLKNLFSEFGDVTSVRIILDRETGRSRGFGFIEIENPVDAETAVKKLDGYHLDHRYIKVSKAVEREPRKKQDTAAAEAAPSASQNPVIPEDNHTS